MAVYQDFGPLKYFGTVPPMK